MNDLPFVDFYRDRQSLNGRKKSLASPLSETQDFDILRGTTPNSRRSRHALCGCGVATSGRIPYPPDGNGQAAGSAYLACSASDSKASSDSLRGCFAPSNSSLVA